MLPMRLLSKPGWTWKRTNGPVLLGPCPSLLSFHVKASTGVSADSPADKSGRTGAGEWSYPCRQIANKMRTGERGRPSGKWSQKSGGVVSAPLFA
jgi:hypothetical protein